MVTLCPDLLLISPLQRFLICLHHSLCDVATVHWFYVHWVLHFLVLSPRTVLLHDQPLMWLIDCGAVQYHKTVTPNSSKMTISQQDHHNHGHISCYVWKGPLAMGWSIKWGGGSLGQYGSGFSCKAIGLGALSKRYFSGHWSFLTMEWYN